MMIIMMMVARVSPQNMHIIISIVITDCNQKLAVPSSLRSRYMYYNITPCLIDTKHPDILPDRYQTPCLHSYHTWYQETLLNGLDYLFLYIYNVLTQYVIQ